MRNLNVVIQPLLLLGGSLLLVPASASAADVCDGIDNDGDGFVDESTVTASMVCNTAIPDGPLNTTTATGSPHTGVPASCDVIVTESRAVLDTNVTVTISHPYAADVEADIVTNAGQQLRLFADVGGVNPNFVSTTLDDESGTSITTGTAPFTGSFFPSDSLDSCISGSSPAGQWTLLVWDDVSGGAGTVESFGLTFEVSNDVDGDGWGASCECDDNDPNAFPGAPEVTGDGIDQDCNGSDTVACYADADLDGVGVNQVVLASDGDCNDPGESLANDDCDDNDPNNFPGNTEVCDSQDNDCDLTVDEGFDGDNDGFTSCAGDCDDNDPTIYFGATELCDGLDTDCDPTTEAVGGEVDTDGDSVLSCSDCDDNDANNFPGNAELCDGQDNNCDGAIDEQFSSGITGTEVSSLSVSNPLQISTAGNVTYTHDIVVSSPITNITDINTLFTANHTWSGDLEIRLISPAGTEVLLADNLSGNTDDAYTNTLFDDEGGSGPIAVASPPFTGAFAPQNPLSAFDGEEASGTWTLSVTDTASGDGGAVTSWELEIEGDAVSVVDDDQDGAASCLDCDDNDPTSYPGATELCDGLDNDCDATTEAPGGEVDVDGDNDLSCSDCDDGDANNYNGNTELCDGQDNDCDGTTYADAAMEVDVDQDGDLSCSDCDDNDAGNFYGNVEVCDGYDNDCNGLADFVSMMGDDDDSAGDDDDSAGDDDDSAGDDDDSAGDDDDSAGDDDDSAGDDDDSAGPDFESEELDIDGDGYLECGQDCDDASIDFAPDAPELCDGFDNDCDGILPDDEADADMDGQKACEGDCDDADATTYLGTKELCDGVDNDCDGTVADEELDTDNDGFAPCDGDCDDTTSDASPSGAEDSAEACSDGLDNDCDELVDLEDEDCDDFAGDDDDAAGDDDDDAAGDDDDDDGDGSSGGCTCTVASDSDDLPGVTLLLLTLFGLSLRRRVKRPLRS